MKAIILAAGIGSRFSEMTKITPKCLIKMGEKTILENQIEILNDQGINEIIVVIGSQGDCWTKENQEKIKKIHKNVVINLENKRKNASYSLRLALENIEEDDLLILDGDLAFKSEVIKKIILFEERIFLAQKIEPEILTNRVKADKKGKVLGVGKHITSDISDIVCIGMMKTKKEDFNLLKKILDEGDYSKDISVLMDGLCKCKDLYFSIEENLVNVNSQEELDKAEKLFKK